jgi:hypothetical protein
MTDTPTVNETEPRPVVTVELPRPRVLVTVSRSWSAWPVMREALAQVHAKYPDAVLVHGDAPRGDRDAAGLWRAVGGTEVEAWPAKWREHGDDCRCPDRKTVCRFAGLRRNLAMVESAPDLCLAFVNKRSRGATQCAEAAEAAGITTLIHRQEEP